MHTQLDVAAGIALASVCILLKDHVLTASGIQRQWRLDHEHDGQCHMHCALAGWHPCIMTPGWGGQSCTEPCFSTGSMSPYAGMQQADLCTKSLAVECKLHMHPGS